MDSQISESHYPVYFQGPPGTGKTHAAKVLAKAMGTNLAIVTLDSGAIDDLIGTSFEREDSKAGRLIDAIIARTNSSEDVNHENQVLIIDEFDRLFISRDQKNSREILSFLQKLLDPTDRSFYSPYLKTTVRLPDTIILAGNSNLQTLSNNDPELEAIVSRLSNIVFDGFSAEDKKSIAYEIIIPKKIKRYRSIGNEFADFSLPEDAYKMIDTFIENDSDIGLRSLEKYITEVFEIITMNYGLTINNKSDDRFLTLPAT